MFALDPASGTMPLSTLVVLVASAVSLEATAKGAGLGGTVSLRKLNNILNEIATFIPVAKRFTSAVEFENRFEHWIKAS